MPRRESAVGGQERGGSRSCAPWRVGAETQPNTKPRQQSPNEAATPASDATSKKRDRSGQNRFHTPGNDCRANHRGRIGIVGNTCSACRAYRRPWLACSSWPFSNSRRWAWAEYKWSILIRILPHLDRDYRLGRTRRGLPSASRRSCYPVHVLLRPLFLADRRPFVSLKEAAQHFWCEEEQEQQHNC